MIGRLDRRGIPLIVSWTVSLTRPPITIVSPFFVVMVVVAV
jgi:hypothetical protein